ncbi:hypothetical protein HYV80_04315 [Candidatus Woesearchaeota archaeon]|nr:hypothetical protein [Candidatus Woesearchaeota archaeon]
MKAKDLFFVILAPLTVFIGVFAYGWKINYLASILLVFGIPSLYLSILNKEKLRKVLAYTFGISIPIAIIFDFAVNADNGWYVPNSVFPYRLFGVMPLENYVWMFFVTYTIIIFYEHFCNKFEAELSPKIKTMFLVLYPISAFILLVHLLNGSFLKVPYIFLYLGIVFFVIPVSIFLYKYPRFFGNFLIVQLYFFYVHMIFELIGLKLTHWTYPGEHYIGWVSFLDLRFPLEEFVFVICIGAFAALAYYEYFAGNQQNSAKKN